MPTSQHWQFDQHLPNDLDVGHAAIEDLMSALSLCGWEGADLFRIQMAVEEAVVNAIEHGNKRDPSKLVHVVFQVTPEKVTMMPGTKSPWSRCVRSQSQTRSNPSQRRFEKFFLMRLAVSFSGSVSRGSASSSCGP